MDLKNKATYNFKMIYITSGKPQVVIVGGGFGGLYAAKSLAGAPVNITLIDKRNFHLFQPLLYQVATGGLSPGDITSPLRAVFKRHKNIRVILGEVRDFKPDEKKVIYDNGELDYDSLILAAGIKTHYFGHDEWADRTLALKTVEDAIEIRRKILLAFELSEIEFDPQKQKELMTFVIVGGGPTGVELAGAIAELSQQTLKEDFRAVNPAFARVILIEAADRLLPGYPFKLSVKTREALDHLGVTVRTKTKVIDIDETVIKVKTDGSEESISSGTVLWAAGMKATSVSERIAARIGATLDPAGRIKVGPNLSLENHADIFIIGDLAHVDGPGDRPLAGVAPVAMQQGKYVAKVIKDRLKGKAPSKPFKYHDKGSLVVIGRNHAVAWFGRFQFSGFFAWLVWVFVHIGYLIEYDNKLIVLIQWAWNYFTRKKGARLITASGKKE